MAVLLPQKLNSFLFKKRIELLPSYVLLEIIQSITMTHFYNNNSMLFNHINAVIHLKIIVAYYSTILSVNVKFQES